MAGGRIPRHAPSASWRCTWPSSRASSPASPAIRRRCRSRTFDGDPTPASAAALLPALEQSIANAKVRVGALDDAELEENWRLVNGDRELFAAPRGAFLRAVMLNHWYHHRGQLTAYLRELDVKIPSIYGPSADENPFV